MIELITNISIVCIILIGMIALTVLLLRSRDYWLKQDTKFDYFRQTHEKHIQDQEQKSQQQQQLLQDGLNDIKFKLSQTSAELKSDIIKELQTHRQQVDTRQLEGMKLLQDSVQKHMHDVRIQIANTLNTNAENINKQLDKLTQLTQERLRDISGQVEKRLSEGFEKTTATFTDIVKRLALIDEAQKRITELSNNVVNLQEVLADRKARGAFGEVQLSALIRNLLPESNFAFQYTLSNDKRADCILFLPEPSGDIVIDAKFPLETYRKIIASGISDYERRTAEQQFKIDIRKHIQDIASKYIIPGETSDGAVMFIPAEAIFAEIHGHYPELVDEAYKARVWLASPTTMMAILTTARAVLKDADTRKQVHVIQEHLGYLAKDFDRFKHRMNNLARHIHQANEDVKDVHTSARKISSRFEKIEKVDLD